MAKRIFRALMQKEPDGWTALCPELDVASQGDTLEQAKQNLKEAVELFLGTAGEQEISERLGAETVMSELEVNIG